MIVDSQAVKNTCTASLASKSFCHYKATNGIKRHLAKVIKGYNLCYNWLGLVVAFNQAKENHD